MSGTWSLDLPALSGIFMETVYAIQTLYEDEGGRVNEYTALKAGGRNVWKKCFCRE